MTLHNYPQRLLLAVTGLSPQVVTETLYAMHRQGEALPTAVHLLSTTEGAERARLTLLTDRWFAKLCHDYQLPDIAFTDEHIHVLENGHNMPMDDIRTPDDNQCAADCISELIRKFTLNEQTSLHVSIAGGRKTMGFYAGYALSLFGRPQDRLSHVLVSSPYESHPQFYYPTPYPQIIYTGGQAHKPLDTQKAQVTLANIPFVRLRHGLSEMVLSGKHSFTKTVNSAQDNLGPPHISIDLENRQVFLAGQQLFLAPVDLAFYSWFARRKTARQSALKCPPDGVAEISYAEDYLQEYYQIPHAEGSRDRTVKTLRKGMEKNFFEQRKSRINKLLRKTLGFHAEAYQIQAVGYRPHTRYQLGLAGEEIDYI